MQEAGETWPLPLTWPNVTLELLDEYRGYVPDEVWERGWQRHLADLDEREPAGVRPSGPAPTVQDLIRDLERRDWDD